MLKEQKNTRKQGDVGLGAAIAFFTQKGITVCVPLTDNQEYDLIVDDGRLLRIQVKTTYSKTPSGNYIVTLKTSGGNKSRQMVKKFDSSQCDKLFILTESNEKYLIPTSVLDITNSITLGKKYDQYKMGD